jgi:hypothetical protein
LVVSGWLRPILHAATVSLRFYGTIEKRGGITMAELIASSSFCALITAQFLAVVFAQKYRNAA